MAAAARAFPAWRDTPVVERIQVMFRYKNGWRRISRSWRGP
jgi:acyl-CoA reductase-like NAD-dependent aldehyde dehydrogenase